MALSHMNFTGNEAQQRHHGYSNNYRQQTQMAVKEKSHHHQQQRPSIYALKGKPWSVFAEYYGCESTDDSDTGDDDPLIASTLLKNRHRKGFVVKLKNKDRALYGTCPETDPFEIVTCRHCRMVLKPSCLENHIKKHEKDKKIERNLESSSKAERIEKISIPSSIDKTHSVTEKLDKISVMTEKYEKPSHTISSNFGGIFDKSADVKQRQRYIMKKPAESPMDASHYDSMSSSDLESKRNKRKRKHDEMSEKSSTFQNINNSTSSPQPSSSTAACRTIYVDQSELVNVIRDASSPPPLAPITSKSNDPQTSVVVQITKFMPTVTATVIDGSFVMQPLEQEEAEIDLKDLKILKPIVKEPQASTENQTLLTSSNFYASQPRPLAMNTFNLKKLNAQSYVMATQRKLVEFGRNLKTDEKVVGAKITPPKTWSFIERSQVFIPFRITH